MTDDRDHEAFGERFVLSSGRDEVDQIEGRILEALDRCGYDTHARFAVRTALEEALTNAMHHGNRNDPSKTLRLEFAADERGVAIVIEDEGLGFDPDSVPDPTRPENVDIPSGRGIMIMRAYMSEVEFERPGNRVRMTYRR